MMSETAPNIDRLLVLGPEASYSDVLAKQMYKDVPIEYAKTLLEITQRVKDNPELTGVLPIKNTMKGSLSEVITELQDRSLRVTGAARLEVNSTIMGLGDLDEARIIAGKDVALDQISLFLPDIPRQAMNSTSAAAEHILRTGDKTMLAVGATALADQYGLTIYRRRAQDNADDPGSLNLTSFLMVKARDGWSYTPDRPSDREVHGTMLFRTERSEEAGALYIALGQLASRAINMTNIESLNMRGKDISEFFITFSCTQHAIADLAITKSVSSTMEMDILGVYDPPILYGS